ncbi:MAG: hypothetical protein KAW02_04925 [candidate division Zixibacteria bacterium]|nr:hypothetical protein [candidate division Zixibacteria bacterium]
MTDTTNKDLAIQAHLAEYSALRDEVLTMIRWREGLVFICLGISGSLLSFALVTPGENSNLNPRFALYLIPLIGFLTGGLWIVNGWRIHRLGLYLREEITVRVNALLQVDLNTKHKEAYQVLGWESSPQRLQSKWKRRLFVWAMNVTCFSLTGTLAQILIQPSPLITKATLVTLRYPALYVVNWVLVVSTFVLLTMYLLKAWKYKAGDTNAQ